MPKILFNKPNGSRLRQKLVSTDASDGNTIYPFVEVGTSPVMVVAYIPVIGDCSHDSHYNIGSPVNISPFNAQLSALYTMLKGKSFTLGNYDPADVGKCLLALDSLYGLLTEFDTDLVALSQYEFDNMAYRGVLADALWRNPATARANIANLITRRNNLCSKLKVIPFVPGIPYLQDHIDWARYVYKDDNLNKSSLIVFRRSGYYRWCCRPSDTYPGTLLLSNNTSGSVYTSLDHTIIYAEDKLDILESLLNDYMLDDDFTDLSVGIAAAFGVDTDRYNIPMIPEDTTKFKLETKFDLNVIDSIRNADFWNLTIGASIVGIDEDTNGHLKYTSNFGSAPDGKFKIALTKVVTGTNPIRYRGIDTGLSRLLLSYEDDPTDEAVRVISAYVHDYVHVNPTDAFSYVYGLKCEFITGIKYYYLDANNTVTQNNAGTFITQRSGGTSSLNPILALARTFIAFPMTYQVCYDGNGILMNTPSTWIPTDIDNIGELPSTANSALAEKYMWEKFFKGSNSKRKPKNKKDDKKDDKPEE